MRLTAVLPGDMTEEQRRVAEESASGKRGHVPTPLRAWLHSPEMGARAQRFGEFVRYDTSLGPVLSELAILVTARHWDSRYEWYAHKKEALKAGLDPPSSPASPPGKHPSSPIRGCVPAAIT